LSVWATTGRTEVARLSLQQRFARDPSLTTRASNDRFASSSASSRSRSPDDGRSTNSVA
jgi:hypothetical protein